MHIMQTGNNYANYADYAEIMQKLCKALISEIMQKLCRNYADYANRLTFFILCSNYAYYAEIVQTG